ncbi:MAG: hypothetical protein E6230_22280, partial [Paenibacillus dendritiformis]|nr:hypothetical protein [Paenibacillus dendritiformis]
FLESSSISNCCIYAGFRLLNRSVWRNRGVLRISTAGWACPGKWFSFQDGGNIHFPAQNFFLNSLMDAICAL